MDDSIYDACPIRAQLTDIGDRLQHSWTPATPKTPGPGLLTSKPSPFGSGSFLGKRKDDGPFGSKPKSVFGNSRSGSSDSPTVPKPIQNPVAPKPKDAFPKGPETAVGQSQSQVKDKVPSASTIPFKKPNFNSNPSTEKDDEFMTRVARDRLELQKMKKTTEKFDKKKAALKIVQTRREENQKNLDNQKKKTIIQPSLMPWAPNPHFILPPASVSALTIEDHKRYVAIISNFIKFDGETRFIFNKFELENMDERLGPEREKYMNHLFEFFKKKKPYNAAFPESLKFVMNRFKERLNSLSESGYERKVKVIEWKTDTRASSSKDMYVRKPQILVTGKQPKLNIPDLSRRCSLNTDPETLVSRFPVDINKSLKQDSTALKLANEHNVSAVLSSCAMRHLLTAPFSLRGYRRAFPVSIIRTFAEGRPQRVLVIGNPVPISNLSKLEIARAYGKYMMREFLEKLPEEQKEIKSYTKVRPLKRSLSNSKEEEIKKLKLDEHAGKLVKSGDGVFRKENDSSNLGEGKKKISNDGGNETEQVDEDNDEVFKKVETGKNQNKPDLVINENRGSKKAGSGANEIPKKNEAGGSLFGNLLESMSSAPLESKTSPTSSTKQISTFTDFFESMSTPLEINTQVSSTHAEKSVNSGSSNVDVLDSILGAMQTPNVSIPTTNSPYTYSTIGIDEEGIQKVLVRSRCHGKDQRRMLISLSTKIEYVPQCGAEAQFEEEKIWNALTAMMKGSEVHANFHINIPDGHCVQLSTVRSGKMFELLSPETKQLISGRWKRLYDLLESLKELASGEFLLVETEDEKLEILEETNSGMEWAEFDECAYSV
ncbi:hypothetical protein FO519_004589 [Halicephalobus sp. NKZ332]|nr:hypothetical protein FO519_004589 [Halicephalobus sp. NKZ332]